MYTEYGYVQWTWESYDGQLVYIYSIVEGEVSMVKSALDIRIPRISLLRQTKSGRDYFMKGRYKVYLDEMEDLIVM